MERPNVAKWVRTGIMVVVAFWLLGKFIITVGAGQVAVLTLFGKVDPEPLNSGLHFVNPLKKVHRVNIQTQEIFEHAEVPSKEGLSVGLEVSVLYHLVPEKAPDIFKNIGPSFQEKVLVPELRSEIRGVTVRFEAKDLYTAGREIIIDQLYQSLAKMYVERGFIVEKVLLRKIALPELIQVAINQKLAAEQDSERMKFVLMKERQEAERKKVEASGISDFQKIVTLGISENLLRWKGIEATEKLAQSNNTKVIVIGAGKDGLPLILDTK